MQDRSSAGSSRFDNASTAESRANNTTSSQRREQVGQRGSVANDLRSRVRWLLRTSVDRLTRIDRISPPLEDAIDHTDSRLRIVADSALRTRLVVRRYRNDPIRLALVCHSPALWGMFDSLYWEAEADPQFEIVVIAVRFPSDTSAHGPVPLEGMHEFLASRGVNVVRGRGSDEADEWLPPESLRAHYVMYQTPYSHHPPGWSARELSLIARVAHIDYGTVLFREDVEAIVHPESFFRHVSLICVENDQAAEISAARFSKKAWFSEDKIQKVGYPKLDYLVGSTRQELEADAMVWPRGLSSDVTRVLWTPRWTTAEGASHFFDYANYFIDFAEAHHEVDLVFRPHPLTFQNFLDTGELSEDEARRLEFTYAEAPNLAIDKTGDYRGTFAGSNILVTDLSSLMLEYLATEKPIIYTHRVDLFNDLGRRLSEGVYWVRSESELDAALAALMAGHDPLMEKRRELAAWLLGTNTERAGRRVLDAIVRDSDAVR